MKTFFKKVMYGFGFIMLGLAMGFSGLTLANENITLEEQIGQLTLTLEKIFVPQNQQEGPNDYAPMPQANGIPSDVPNPTCLDNYQDWPHSNTYKANVDWNLDFLTRGEWTVPYHSKYDQFLDLNGDGLSDYIYSFKYYLNSNGQSSTKDQTCVYLNTGRSLEPAYRCIASVNHVNDTQDYWGDCAEI